MISTYILTEKNNKPKKNGVYILFHDEFTLALFCSLYPIVAESSIWKCNIDYIMHQYLWVYICRKITPMEEIEACYLPQHELRKAQRYLKKRLFLAHVLCYIRIKALRKYNTVCHFSFKHYGVKSIKSKLLLKISLFIATIMEKIAKLLKSYIKQTDICSVFDEYAKKRTKHGIPCDLIQQ